MWRRGKRDVSLFLLIFVLEAKTEFIYKGKKYIMKKGDAVYFDSTVSHSGSSLGKKKAKLLSIIFNYKRI
jgi:quercetin dioxygenase-like cupin family protein